jgi:aspartate/methionine/tyrosine aminotransferase
MRERTVKIGSAGKMFGMTGWKVGFLCAAPALTRALAGAHQFLTFTTPPNLQEAVAFGLEQPATGSRPCPPACSARATGWRRACARPASWCSTAAAPISSMST